MSKQLIIKNTGDKLIEENSNEWKNETWFKELSLNANETKWRNIILKKELEYNGRNSLYK